MTFEQARLRLLELARANGGLLTAATVEAEPDLGEDQATVSAAGHALAGSTNAFGAIRTSEGWFPYEEIQFTELR